MNNYLLLICLILSFSLYGQNLKPCQMIGYEQVVREALPPENSISWIHITLKERKHIIAAFKKCLDNSAVCIVEVDPKSKKSRNWLNDKLEEPVDGNFDPEKRDLFLGLLQYVDKKSGSSICIVAYNTFTRVGLWGGKSWIIDKNDIKGYEIDGVEFNLTMTPSSLYKALLTSHQNAVESAIQDGIEFNNNIDTAKQMLEEGSDPSFVSKFTGVSPWGIKLLQQ